jgi:hypothetical protein
LLNIEYISETAAIEQIFEITGIKITTKVMKECAKLGVIPAYMEFNPKDKKMYPDEAFQLVGCDVLAEVEPGKLTDIHGYASREWGPLPFPLPKNGMVTIKEDTAYDRVRSEASVPTSYKVFVARSDNKLEEVSERHFVRVYAPQEMRQAAKNFERYFTGRGCQPMKHSRCQSVDYGEITIEVPATFISPFAGSADALSFNKLVRKGGLSLAKDQSGEELPNMGLVIAGMLELIKELKGPSYNKAKINVELQRILPKDIYRGMSEKRINQSFAEATKAMEAAKPKPEVRPLKT